ncbi:MAG: phosphoglycerate dehydrogenase [Prolixibacteraceae bacterium]|nr:phosphoglycerate dehydrogenase [Prolixibacteraceae bacterium]
MYKIKTINKIDPNGLKKFPLDKYEIASEFDAPDAIIVRSQSLHEMDFPKSLKAIARAGAGVNNIPLDKCTSQGIVVFNSPGANAQAVKELVIAGLLLSSRKIAQSIEWVKTLAGKGDEVPKLIEAGKKEFKGNEIYGKTLAVIGLGAIGVLIANAAQSLGMKVLGYDPYISVKHAWNLNHNIKQAKGIEMLLSNADYVTIHVPQMAETKGYINAEKINMMKDGVRIMNFARGGLIVEEDMKNALESGKVGVYATDFVDDAVLKMKNVIPISHLGASTEESEINCAVMAANEVQDFLENGNITNSVNFPNASMERHGGSRIVITNKNIPKMVGQISNILADESVNIDNMLNRNRDDIAYNIIDIDGNVSESTINKISAIEGVISVRLIK